jgi:hypothetical protein
MSLKWLIEAYTEKEEMEGFVKSIKNLGYECIETTKIPSYMSVDDYFEDDSCVISHTSIQTAAEIYHKKKWYPGTFCNFKEYRCSQFYPILGKYLFNADYIMLPYGDLVRRKEFIFDTIGSEGHVFIRPDSGFKTFTGTLLEQDRFEKDLPNLGYGAIDPSELVVLAPPRNIQREWRIFATKEGVITGSLYRVGEEKQLSKDVPQEVYDYANEIATKGGYWPDPVFSIDICRGKDDNLYLLEFGCFSSSGTYHSNSDLLASVVSKKAIEIYEDLMDLSGAKNVD